jgi:hypothetical protein
MRYLRLISIAMAASGVALIAISLAFDLSGLWTVIGMMLTIAGLVKIATVAIWNGVVGLGPIKTSDDD